MPVIEKWSQGKKRKSEQKYDSGLCEGEKENGSDETKMLALVDFVFAVFINSNFFSAAGNCFSLVSASKTLKLFLKPHASASLIFIRIYLSESISVVNNSLLNHFLVKLQLI